MRSTYIKIIFTLFISLCFSGCIDEISFPQIPSNEDNLVIQGKLTKGDPSIVSVSIDKIGALSDTLSTTAVEVQSVSLLNDLGQAILLERKSRGSYQTEVPATSPIFSVLTNRSYQLEVSLTNDEIIRSSLEPLLPVPKVDSVSFDIESRDILDRNGLLVDYTYLTYRISTPSVINETQSSLLRWTFEGCSKYIELTPPETIPPFPPPDTCYIKEKLNIDKVFLFDGRNAGNNYLTNFSTIEETLNSRYVFGYYLSVFQESLSPGAYTYWNQVSQVTQRDGGLFETPAGEIESNFVHTTRPDQIIYGYFYAVAQDTFRQYISPKDVGYPLHSCGEFSGDGYFDGPRRCRDCLQWKNSSFNRPTYWIEK